MSRCSSWGLCTATTARTGRRMSPPGCAPAGAARGLHRRLVSDIRLFDIYEGTGLPEGKKSLAIAVTLQPQDATLTNAEIDAFSKRLVAAVEKATGGMLRG